MNHKYTLLAVLRMASRIHQRSYLCLFHYIHRVQYTVLCNVLDDQCKNTKRFLLDKVIQPIDALILQYSRD